MHNTRNSAITLQLHSTLTGYKLSLLGWNHGLNPGHYWIS